MPRLGRASASAAAEATEPEAALPLTGLTEDEKRQGAALRALRRRSERRGRLILAISAIIAALLHAAIVALLILDWSGFFGAPAPGQPTAIPVALIFEPPKPPPPAPPQAVEPPPLPPEIKPRMSGSEEKTEAAAEEKPQPALPQPKPQTEKPQPRRASSDRATERQAPAASTESKTSERQAALAPEPRKAAPSGELFHAIRLPSAHGGDAERDRAGDPYLNRLRDLVERNRIYPPASEFPGGGERLAVYSIVIEPTGDLTAITLLESSGSNVLDEAAGRMIRISTPFPPLPLNYPSIRTLITVAIPLFPNPR